jgi:hypothetical protein
MAQPAKSPIVQKRVMIKVSVKQIYSNSRRKFAPFWRRTRLRSGLYAFVNFPVYLLAKLIPKRNHSIYGSFSGQLIGDNSLSRFIGAQSDGTNHYFVSKSRQAILDSKIAHGAVYSASPRGIWIQLTASRAYFSHTINDFYAPAIMGATVVALGHGVPIKKSAAADRELTWIHNAFFRAFLLTFFPYLYHYYCNEVHSPSPFFDQYKAEVYGYTKPKIIRAPMPRMQAKKSEVDCQPRRMLFAPTFRKKQRLLVTLEKAGLFTTELENTLRIENLELWIKPHYLDEAQINEISLPKNVRWLVTDDINRDILQFPALITDYSSIFYDAALAGLAVEFVNHDLDIYRSSDSELFDWFIELSRSYGSRDLAGAMFKVTNGTSTDLRKLLEIG